MLPEVMYMNAEKNIENKTGRRAGRLAGIAAMVLLVMIIIPVAAVMFIVSGVWTALDRMFLRFDR